MSAPQSAKLVLLGESAVGKSSLVLQFVRGEFSDFRESTIGAAFLTQTVQIAGKDGSPPRTLKFEIWDTAGQERYKSLAPIYYRNATASLVVYDITSPPSFEKAKTWIRDLRRQADPGLVILLCGNKKDLPGREVSTETGEAYAKEEGLLFLEASAKSGEGVKEIFDLIAETLPAPTPKPTAGGTGAAAGGVNLAAGGAGGDGAGAKDGCAC